MKKTILIIIVLAAVAGGCKKSTRISKRIYGYHTLTNYTVNGVDSLSLYKDSLGTEFHFYKITGPDGNNYNDCHIYRPGYDGNYPTIVFLWSLSNDYKFLTVNSGGCECLGTGPFGGNRHPTWEILKVKSNYLKMKTTYNNKEYEIELE